MTGYSNTVYFVINSRLEAGCVYVARLYTSFSSSFIRYFTSKYWLLSFLFQGVVKKLGEIKTTVSCLNEYSFAGKAVFCEKPITSDTDSTASSYDLAERQKQPLFCAFHRYLISFVYCSFFSYVTNYTFFFFFVIFLVLSAKGYVVHCRELKHIICNMNGSIPLCQVNWNQATTALSVQPL